MNYLPTWARTPIEMWTNVPPEILERELSFVRGLGFNAIRIWLSAWGYEREPSRYLSNLKRLLDLCAASEIGVTMNLFDSCGVEPYAAAVERPLYAALQEWGDGDPSIVAIKSLAADPRVDLFEAPAIVQIPDRGHGSGLIWEGWVPSPGYNLLGREHRARWRSYATTVSEALREHPALTVLDVMNEPFMSQIGTGFDTELVLEFLSEMVSTVTEAAPNVPVTVGAESLDDLKTYESSLSNPLDVVSYHDYGLQAVPFHQPDLLRRSMQDVLDYAGGRPVFLSEWGLFPGVHEEDQHDNLASDLSVLGDAPVGWAIFHLIAGYGPFALASLLYPNGTMKLAAKLLRRSLRGIHVK